MTFTYRPFVMLLLTGFLSCKIFQHPGPSFGDSGKVPNVRIAQGTGIFAAGPCEPSVAISRKNPALQAAGAVMDGSFWSSDGGKTWQRDTLKSSFGVFGDPVLISDTAGHFFYAHLSDPEGLGWASTRLLDRIVVQHSTNGGQTYNDGVFLGENHPKDQDKPWLCVDPKTNAIYAAWTEFDQYNSRDTLNHRSRIQFCQSRDGGTTWTTPVTISQFDGDCLDDDNTPEGAVPAAGPNGEIFVAWAWNNKIWFDKSTDGGKTWLKADIVAALQPGGWTFDIPGIMRCNGLPVLVSDLSGGPNNGTLYLNWSDQRNGPNDTDIWLSKSTDSGNSWSTPIRVNNDKKGRQQFLNWIAVDQTTGYLYLVFYDRRRWNDNRTDVYLAASRDGGTTFKNYRISEKPFTPIPRIFFGDYNHIDAHGGTVRPIWTRLDHNVLSIWTGLIQW